jgi:hypothetical protein
MRQSFFSFLIPFAIVAVICITAAIGLHYSAPKLLLFLDALLTDHTIFVGIWLSLSAAGLDYTITTAYRKLRFAEVGAKSAAQLNISRS